MDFQISTEDFIVAREEERERIERLLRALEQIPPRQREILYLRFYCRLEYADICQMMGITYQVARNQLSLALASVRRTY
jgi:RNA polymerase sigma factor (sigma-70 family)